MFRKITSLFAVLAAVALFAGMTPPAQAVTIPLAGAAAVKGSIQSGSDLIMVGGYAYDYGTSRKGMFSISTANWQAYGFACAFSYPAPGEAEVTLNGYLGATPVVIHLDMCVDAFGNECGMDIQDLAGNLLYSTNGMQPEAGTMTVVHNL